MFVHRIRAVNDTDAPLKVAKFETSCACTGYRLHGESIPPHGELPIDLIIDLREEDASLPRDFSTSVSLTVEAASGRQVLQSAVVSGRVESSPISMSDSSARFITVVQGVDDEGPRTITVTTTLPQNDFSIEPDGTVVRSVELENVGSQGEHALTFTLDPDLTLGPFTGYVRLVAPAKAGRAFYLPVRGRVVDDVYTIPSQLTLGARPLGAVARDHITFRTRSGRPISRIDVTDSPEGIRLDVAGHKASPVTHVFRVEIPITSPGAIHHKLRFEVHVEGEPAPRLINVPVVYTGRSQQDTNSESLKTNSARL